ncbi:WD repeat-containing protein 13 [Biomphalaria pfeifferi]|uniref:WD repeat-containing protein 13 n=1 Tax=Biomphalaria pfeifferi TaxID=112525 RepID=A0AAD8B844_BIOPF|nr:WD repeat-containing protein 13 [Biomphalaria pfeifferi]
MAVWQQVLALDAKFNAYRSPNNPQFRTLYIRRRSQLLREHAKNEKDGSIKSRSFSLRSIGRTIESLESMIAGGDNRKFFHHRRHMSTSSLKYLYEGPMKHVYDSIEVVPTSVAEASKAMAGGKSLSENYAFTGMHHIFDQHSNAVTCVKFANDDRSRVACSSLDGTLSICQLIPPPATVICMLKGHSAGVTDFVWSLSNDVILSVSLDGTARLWDVAAGTCMRVIEDSLGSELLCCVFQPLNNNMFVISFSVILFTLC